MDTPVIAIGPVTDQGKDLPSGQNDVVDYIDEKGYYDIFKFCMDHQIQFPGLHTIIIVTV